LSLIGATIILELFSQFMEEAGRIQSGWKDAGPDTDHGRWIRDCLRTELGGEARRRGSAWRWSFGTTDEIREIDLDMASSGQRANWPLMLLPQTLSSLRAAGELDEHLKSARAHRPRSHHLPSVPSSPLLHHLDTRHPIAPP
jgi:hypothetical protein